jgi:hypothetical protein
MANKDTGYGRNWKKWLARPPSAGYRTSQPRRPSPACDTSVSNTAEYGQRIRRLRVAGWRRGQRCREPNRQEGWAGQAP